MSRGNDKKVGKRMNKRDLTALILHYFEEKVDDSITLKQLFERLHLTTHPLKMLCVEILEELVEDNYLTEIERHRYKLSSYSLEMTGTFQRKSNGRNWFVPEEGGEPILIAERNSRHALNGDKVRIAFYAKRKGRGPEGEVVEILERAEGNFVGTLDINKNYAFLLNDDKNLANDIFIPKDKLKGAKNGDKVVVRITEWPEKARNPIGEVVDVLGKAGENNTEMHAILAEFGLPYKYPEAVEKAAEYIQAGITDEEVARREDFRNVLTFTIDPKDAKDFDDALSLRRLNDNLWEVGVHIADVTHYVKERTLIDKEAYKRATSVYLVDRTIPMLPEKLCNNLCSLRPDEDKLCYSVIFHIDDRGEVKKSRIAHTVIRSNRRFCYEEVQEILEAKQGEMAEELLTLDHLAKVQREKRFKNGAINFDRYEVKFDIDETGKPIGVYFKESTDATQLIEEFMLLANRTVAERIGRVPKGKKAKVFPYRIHDVPDPDKLMNLSQFISRWGYKVRATGSKETIAKSINNMLNNVKGQKEQDLIENITIRAMAKARYSVYNIGHYGLALEYYTHFTSPIRRYPDMMVHRLLTRYLDEDKRTVNEQTYENYCEHCSDMEQTAANAERASTKYKQVEFMQDRLGQVFEGVISGITEWGLYVELNDNKCEGMIPIRDLDNDYYEFDEKNYCLRGRHKQHIYQLGDPLKVKVARTNLEKRQLDFVLAEE
ncbi:MAG: ribonuclease R [Bacteroidaceae bacterium]|nr:ribonuclease R [Bacteroidaceae bacterium]